MTPTHEATTAAVNSTSSNWSTVSAALDAWETARKAYGKLLATGFDVSDAELAQRPEYNRLLFAALHIHRLGGADAVESISRRLGQSFDSGCPGHFQRLWAGLLPNTVHLSKDCQ